MTLSLVRTPIDIKKCNFFILDGGSNSLTMTLGDGSFNWTRKTEIKYIKNRGVLDTVMYGDQMPLEVRFEATAIRFKSTGSEPVTIYEALTQEGGAAAWASTDTDPCAPYAVDLKIDYKPACPTVKKEDTLLTDFRQEDMEYDAKSGMVKISGKCNVTEPTFTRLTNTT